jgi:hypothetical protein
LETIEISDQARAREEIHRRLREVGLLVTPNGPPTPIPTETFEPIQGSGTPLSEIVKEERQTR